MYSLNPSGAIRTQAVTHCENYLKTKLALLCAVCRLIYGFQNPLGPIKDYVNKLPFMHDENISSSVLQQQIKYFNIFFVLNKSTKGKHHNTQTTNNHHL